LLNFRSSSRRIVEIAREEETHRSEVTFGHPDVIGGKLAQVNGARRFNEEAGTITSPSIGRTSATVRHRGRGLEG
jgi:hypothetical protein